MQNLKPKNQIKIEIQNLRLFRKEVENFLLTKTELRISTINKVLDVYDTFVNRDNITKLYMHPVPVFLDALLNQNLTSLYHHTEIHVKS